MLLMLGRTPIDAVILGTHLAKGNSGPLDPCGDPVDKMAVWVLKPDLHPGPMRDARMAMWICHSQSSPSEHCIALYQCAVS